MKKNTYMTAQIIYNGKLRTTATHIQSGSILETDAPKDNHGLGEKFSPTDLVATALGSCMLSIMGIASNTHQIHIEGTKVDVLKIMQADPRKIAEIQLQITMPTDKQYTEKEKIILERAAMNCPVLLSLNPDVKKTVSFMW